MMGIDGCGKTTQAAMASHYLVNRGMKVWESKAHPPIIESVINPWRATWDGFALNFLFQALYTQQRVESEKAIEDGKIVVADRWDESYLAYHTQYGPLSQDSDFREAMHRYAFQGLFPNIGFMLILQPYIAKQRTFERDRGGVIDRRNEEYFVSIQSFYLKLAEERGYYVIPAEASSEEVHEVIVSHLDRLILF